ncbi:hypothetical protein [Bosea sp. PAMC 26642]|uniref:hypothetical protein n=1 Tax=Bosea sp. (strain PAMC 26642) TaxID=1792307 RepID=UPI0007701420|nr:hypothetical protein [Bosea sp. PAMC 26642]AMJ60197.1 hypothetical protein AXW83_07715 [Bosea sp. PAMC 26642]
MRKLLIAAAFAIGAATLTSGAIAAPAVAGATDLSMPTDIQQAQYGGRSSGMAYEGRRGRSRYYAAPRRYGPPGRGYGRRYGGPPPHARAWGRRGYDRPYYRY